MSAKRLFRQLTTGSIFTLLLALFFVMLFWRHMVITVPAGHAGVMWWRFFNGTETADIYKEEGIHLIFPWDQLVIYDSRLLERTSNFDAVAKDGLTLKISASIRWRVRKNKLAILHRTIGPNYFNRLILPQLGSVFRENIAKFNGEEVYGSNRNQVQKAIHDIIINDINEIGGRNEEISADLISIMDVLIIEVELPASLQAAINRKFAEDEYVEEYRFKVKTEELESTRKEIEANGIRRFQEIVAPTISDAYLRWTGIQATLKLAQSPNSKVVIMGNGPDGLPVILNGFDGEKTPILPEAMSTQRSSDALPK